MEYTQYRDFICCFGHRTEGAIILCGNASDKDRQYILSPLRFALPLNNAGGFY